MHRKSTIKTTTRLVSLAVVVSGSALSTTAVADVGDQLHKLLADDGTAGDRMGNAVAVFETTAIIGASSDDEGTGVRLGVSV